VGLQIYYLELKVAFHSDTTGVLIISEFVVGVSSN